MARIREQVGDGKVICGLSGGVDSSVAALLHLQGGGRPAHVRVRGPRADAQERGQPGRGRVPRPLQGAAVHVDAEARFLGRLAGVTEPEAKRKIIGKEFIRVFEQGGRAAREPALPRAGHPLLRRDRVGGGTGAATISRTTTSAVSPRTSSSSGRAAAQPVQRRGPPGRAGARDARAARLAPALPGSRPRDPHRERRGQQGAARDPRDADSILQDEIRTPACTASCGSPSACCRPTCARVGVQGDERTYGYRSIRAVTTRRRHDRRLRPPALRPARAVASRMINEIAQVNRVTLDITSKPPGTIEWESPASARESVLCRPPARGPLA